MLLSCTECKLGIADRLARCFPDHRHRQSITHTLTDMIRARIFAIASRYEDCKDLDSLRKGPAFKLACGRLPDSNVDLWSHRTFSRLQNASTLKGVIGLTYTLVDQWMASYAREPASVIPDIDDTYNVAHGQHQLSLFNSHYDECSVLSAIYARARRRRL